MDKLNCIVLDIYRGARELPVPDFQEMALGLLKSVLQFDSGMWGAGEITPAAGLVMQSIHLHNQPEEMLRSYENIKEHDRAAFEARKHIGETCNFNFRDIYVGREHAAGIAHNKRFSMGNLLVTTNHDQRMSSVDFLSLWRAKDHDRYTEEDRLLGAILMPHMIEAGTINRLLWLNQMTAAVIAKRGAHALGGCEGTLYIRDEEFLAIVRKEWPEWGPPMLPRPLLESLRGSTEYRFMGKRITVLASVVGDMLFLRARERSSVDVLTPAERMVAKHIANGHAYKQVARELGVSLATVRNQLHSVYQKLGINNKATLARFLTEGDM